MFGIMVEGFGYMLDTYLWSEYIRLSTNEMEEDIDPRLKFPTEEQAKNQIENFGLTQEQKNNYKVVKLEKYN